MEQETEEEEGSKAGQIHLHRVGFSCPRLPVGEDADVVAIDAGGDQGLNLLKHLGGTREHQEKMAASPLAPAAPPSPWDGSTHLLLGRLWGEDLIQLEGHLLPLVQEVQDSVIVGVEGHCVGRLRTLTVLLRDGADSPENTDVSLEGDAETVSALAHPATTPRALSNTGRAERRTPLPTTTSHLRGARSTHATVMGWDAPPSLLPP